MTDDAVDPNAADEARVADARGEDARPATSDATFDWRGWALVALVVCCFLVIPGIILYVPAASGLTFLGVPYIHTLVALPMIPALVLGLVAVFVTARE